MGLDHWFRTGSGAMSCNPIVWLSPVRFSGVRWKVLAPAADPHAGAEERGLVGTAVESWGLLMFLCLFPVRVLIAGSHH